MQLRLWYHGKSSDSKMVERQQAGKLRIYLSDHRTKCYTVLEFWRCDKRHIEGIIRIINANWMHKNCDL